MSFELLSWKLWTLLGYVSSWSERVVALAFGKATEFQDFIFWGKRIGCTDGALQELSIDATLKLI